MEKMEASQTGESTYVPTFGKVEINKQLVEEWLFESGINGFLKKMYQIGS